ncbi:ATP-binding cassette domain-containing protein [Xylanibacillus composti]|uniref:Phosphonates import ATP-binding protein PhnC 1 n=1 Tax=Xylanibacillus composti TaxID=1572762 RepID=A0A8J4H3U3_9BACL|nr:ATP-binding cassette domain-containing protein [Xylanibacillus composti]MDT9725381.1 ATP-binding cassette domain-containing protein [Xylanibacillus composti]GIQ69145.1 phosphonates import ATP-binding protein PhnC 1 [Xylanibacillus composti]
MPDTEMFALEQVCKSYGAAYTLHPLDLHIRKGEIVALIGPSGAGKTTCLNMLAGTIRPDAGSLRIAGKPAESYASGKQLAKVVGMIRQQFDLVGSLPVIHNVLAGRLHEWGLGKSLLSFLFPQDKPIAADALHRVGLADKLYDKTANLSGGEQQRVALARLLVQHPQAILADEPIASLDPARAEDVLGMLVRLVREENLTLVSSLHSVELARQFFERMIAIKEGRIFFDLPTAQVTDQLISELYQLEHAHGTGAS